jgi:hypothetical protein
MSAFTDRCSTVPRIGHTVAVIRFMGEEGVDVPLWGDEGLIYSDSEEFTAALGPFGLSRELAADVVTWARDWQTQSGLPEHDAEAARLIRRLRAELGHGFPIVYKP